MRVGSCKDKAKYTPQTILAGVYLQHRPVVLQSDRPLGGGVIRVVGVQESPEITAPERVHPHAPVPASPRRGAGRRRRSSRGG